MVYSIDIPLIGSNETLHLLKIAGDELNRNVGDRNAQRKLKHNAAGFHLFDSYTDRHAHEEGAHAHARRTAKMIIGFRQIKWSK